MMRLHIARMRRFVEVIGYVTILLGGASLDASMVPAVVCMGIGAVLIGAANLNRKIVLPPTKVTRTIK